MAQGECKNCDAPAGPDEVCDECRRDPETNNCDECGKHLAGINYPYVCGACFSKNFEERKAAAQEGPKGHG